MSNLSNEELEDYRNSTCKCAVCEQQRAFMTHIDVLEEEIHSLRNDLAARAVRVTALEMENQRLFKLATDWEAEAHRRQHHGDVNFAEYKAETQRLREALRGAWKAATDGSLDEMDRLDGTIEILVGAIEASIK